MWFGPSHPEHETAQAIFGPQEPGTLDFEALQKAVKKLQPKTRKPVSVN